LGASVIDADAISRSSTASGGAAIGPIAATLGAQYIAADGALDRARVRELVFSDPQAKAQLEGIIHPLVAMETERLAVAAEHAGAPLIVFDIPLLVESVHWRTHLSRVLVVDCSEATQIARVASRNQLAEADIRNIIRAQASRERRLAAADLVLFNEGLSLDALAQEVRQVAARFGL
jgi:dephospho-CoA kinase